MRENTLDEVSGDIASFLRTAYQGMVKSEKFRRRSGPMNPRVMVLRMLAADSGMTISSIGDKLNISRPNMTAIIGSLIKDGLVRRTPDKEDRRKVHVSITEKGRRFSDRLSSTVKEAIKERLASMDERELSGLHDAMKKVRELYPEGKNEEG